MIPPTDAVLNGISQEFSYGELAEATGNFSSSRRLGEGTYGTVFRGCLRDGTEVAIKFLASPKEGGFREEVEVLSRFRHPNLVILMGFARQGRQRYLVYELLPGGDLHSRLNKDAGFHWRQRLSVVLDASLGLSHLHGWRPQVFHRDVKTQNILIDRNGTGKVADFGLACLAQPNQHSLAVTLASGTLGYADPLYIRSGVVTEKSEVYSLGMVLLEVLTGRPPALQHPDGRIEYQFEHIGGELRRLIPLVDARARWPPNMVELAGNLGLTCTCAQDQSRPSFVQIVTQMRRWLREEPPPPGQGAGLAPTPAYPAPSAGWRGHAEAGLRDRFAGHDRQCPALQRPLAGLSATNGGPADGLDRCSPAADVWPAQGAPVAHQAVAIAPQPERTDHGASGRLAAATPIQAAGGCSSSTNPFAMPSAAPAVAQEQIHRYAGQMSQVPFPAHPQGATAAPQLLVPAAEPQRAGWGTAAPTPPLTELPAAQEEPPPATLPLGREEDVARLVEMGFQPEQAIEAFRRCSTIEAAAEWIMSREW